MEPKHVITLLDVDLFKELGLESLSIEQKKQLGEQMIKTVWQMILVRILEILNDKQKDELYELMNSKDPEFVNNYLKSVIPDYDNLVKEEIAEYKKILISSIKDI